jgi:hypothetical protein
MSRVAPLGKRVGKGGFVGGAWHPLVRIAKLLRAMKEFEIRNSKFEIAD